MRLARVAGDAVCWLAGQLLALLTLGAVAWTALWAWGSWESGDPRGAAELGVVALALLSVPLAYWFLDDLRRRGRTTPPGPRPRGGAVSRSSEDEEQKHDHDH